MNYELNKNLENSPILFFLCFFLSQSLFRVFFYYFFNLHQSVITFRIALLLTIRYSSFISSLSLSLFFSFNSLLSSHVPPEVKLFQEISPHFQKHFLCCNSG